MKTTFIVCAEKWQKAPALNDENILFYLDDVAAAATVAFTLARKHGTDT